MWAPSVMMACPDRASWRRMDLSAVTEVRRELSLPAWRPGDAWLAGGTWLF